MKFWHPWCPEDDFYWLWGSPTFHLVRPASHSLIQWNISTSTWWIGTTFCTNIHGSQIMNVKDFGHPLTFSVTPPWGSHLWHRHLVKISIRPNTLVYDQMLAKLCGSLMYFKCFLDNSGGLWHRGINWLWLHRQYLLVRSVTIHCCFLIIHGICWP